MSSLQPPESSEAEGAKNNGDRVQRIAKHVRGLIEELGLDPEDSNLHETDVRVAKMYLEMFHGLEEGAEPSVTTFPNEEGYSHLIMEKDIPFYSMCAHHLVPFYGKAHIAYFPRSGSSACRSSPASSTSTPGALSSRNGLQNRSSRTSRRI